MATQKSEFNLPNGSGGFDKHHFETEVDQVVGLKQNYRQPSTAYTAGQIAYHSALPTGWYLECTTAGISGSGDLTISTTTIGTTVSDGTVVWTVVKNLPAYGRVTMYGDNNIYTRDKETGSLYFSGGHYGRGAWLELCGKDKTGYAGNFSLESNDGTNKAQLKGYPTGELTWTGRQTYVEDDLGGSAIVAKSLGINGYIKYASGLIVQWGRVSPSQSSGYELAVDLPISYTGQSSYVTIVTARTGNHDYMLNIGAYNSTSSKIGIISDTNWSSVPISATWLTIGY